MRSAQESDRPIRRVIGHGQNHRELVDECAVREPEIRSTHDTRHLPLKKPRHLSLKITGKSPLASRPSGSAYDLE